MFKEKPYLGFR